MPPKRWKFDVNKMKKYSDKVFVIL
jgi:hypothetical protein